MITSKEFCLPKQLWGWGHCGEKLRYPYDQHLVALLNVNGYVRTKRLSRSAIWTQPQCEAHTSHSALIINQGESRQVVSLSVPPRGRIFVTFFSHTPPNKWKESGTQWRALSRGALTPQEKQKKIVSVTSTNLKVNEIGRYRRFFFVKLRVELKSTSRHLIMDELVEAQNTVESSKSEKI